MSNGDAVLEELSGEWDFSDVEDPRQFMAELEAAHRAAADLVVDLDGCIAQCDAVLTWIREQRRLRIPEEVIVRRDRVVAGRAMR